MKTILNGIFKENPVFVLMLGLCPALAVTSKFENAYMMGICIVLILFFSTSIIALIKNIIPDNVRIPVYILIIGTFVTIIELLLKKYIPGIYEAFSIYLSLIVVNCIVLGNNLSIPKSEKYFKSILKAIGVGIGFTFALCLIALIREVLGSNTITLMDSLSKVTGYRAVYKVFPANNLLPINVLSSPAGSFLILGILLALFNFIKNKRGEKHESN